MKFDKKIFRLKFNTDGCIHGMIFWNKYEYLYVHIKWAARI